MQLSPQRSIPDHDERIASSKLRPCGKERLNAFLFREPTDKERKFARPLFFSWIAMNEVGFHMNFLPGQPPLNELLASKLTQYHKAVHRVVPSSREAMKF